MNSDVSIRKSLYLKYRPKNFTDLVGQDNIKKILIASSKTNNISQGYLLVGPRGTGKTTTARLIAKSINCPNLKDGVPCDKCDSCINIQLGHYLDVIEIDAASNTGVDDMRDLIEKAQFAPTLAKKKVYIIDEVHMLSKSAFNALLKTLEEPPSHVHFILATTEVNKIPLTIISRCQRFDFGRISVLDIVQRLQYICGKEGFEYENEALEIIASNSDGGMRDAISLLEQIVLDNKVTVENIEFALGIVKGEIIHEFINLILEKKTNVALNLINKIYQDGVNLIQFKKETLQYLRKLILEAVDKDDSKEKINRYLELIELINKTNVENSFIPQFPIEIMICKATLSNDKVIKSLDNSYKIENTKPVDVNLLKKEKEIDKDYVAAEEYKFTSEEFPEQKFIIKPTLDKIRDDWSKIISKIENPTLRMSLQDVFIEKYDQDILEISSNSEFHYNRIKMRESIFSIENALKEYFAVNIVIKCSLSKIDVKKEEVVKSEEVVRKEKIEILESKAFSDETVINIDTVQDLFNS